jgi:hypothetical protein
MAHAFIVEYPDYQGKAITAVYEDFADIEFLLQEVVYSLKITVADVNFKKGRTIKEHTCYNAKL